jgi:cold shock CspA family protein
MDFVRRPLATTVSPAAGRGGNVNTARGTHGPHPREVTRVPDSGQIVRLCTGQCYGTIRTADGREVWFHRSDMSDRASFNDFVVGDSVTFELVHDPISGARALSVQRNRPGSRTSAV